MDGPKTAPRSFFQKLNAGVITRGVIIKKRWKSEIKSLKYAGL